MTYQRAISIELCIYSHHRAQKMFSWHMENSCLLGMPWAEPTRVCLSRRCCHTIDGTAVTQVLWNIATKASRPNQQSLHSSCIKSALLSLSPRMLHFRRTSLGPLIHQSAWTSGQNHNGTHTHQSQHSSI